MRDPQEELEIRESPRETPCRASREIPSDAREIPREKLVVARGGFFHAVTPCEPKRDWYRDFEGVESDSWQLGLLIRISWEI